MKISQRVFESLRGHEIMTDGQTDGQTDRQTDGQGDYYRTPPTTSGGALIKVIALIINFGWKSNPFENDKCKPKNGTSVSDALVLPNCDSVG